MGMHRGIEGAEAIEEPGRDEVTHRRVEIESLRQVMTSWGALSSAWQKVSYAGLLGASNAGGGGWRWMAADGEVGSLGRNDAPSGSHIVANR